MTGRKPEQETGPFWGRGQTRGAWPSARAGGSRRVGPGAGFVRTSAAAQPRPRAQARNRCATSGRWPSGLWSRPRCRLDAAASKLAGRLGSTDTRCAPPAGATDSRCSSPTGTTDTRCSSPAAATDTRCSSPAAATDTRFSFRSGATDTRYSPPAGATDTRYSIPAGATEVRYSPPFGAADTRYSFRSGATDIRCSPPAVATDTRCSPPAVATDTRCSPPAVATNTRCSPPAVATDTRCSPPAGVLRTVVKPVVVVHGGGASNFSSERKERVRQGIIRAAKMGYKILRDGGSAVDAVECAVAILENDPEFNAGCGSVLNINGDIEMDASIMDGKDLSSGAVSAVRCIANPVKLARLVMDKTPHCFLTDQGAAKFAQDMGVQQIPVEELITTRNKKHLEREKEELGAQKADCAKHLGTVGAVAMDCRGNLAYATSTGGIVNKMVGRVGDSPCIGSGGYADNNIGAISTTGHGESILKVNLARLALFHVEQGKSVEKAADLSLEYMKSRVKGLGGLIMITKTGEWTARWTSTSMPWAAAQDGKVYAGIDLNETTITDMCS